LTPDRVNAFKYLTHDPDGLCCPISSHVRRANPRGSSAESSWTVVSRRRILRRGRSYDSPLPDDAALAGREPDPIVGNSAGRCHITIPAEPVRLRLDGVPTVVTHVGGGYFFHRGRRSRGSRRARSAEFTTPAATVAARASRGVQPALARQVRPVLSSLRFRACAPCHCVPWRSFAVTRCVSS
jgi:hypothetical protein